MGWGAAARWWLLDKTIVTDFHSYGKGVMHVARKKIKAGLLVGGNLFGKKKRGGRRRKK